MDREAIPLGFGFHVLPAVSPFDFVVLSCGVRDCQDRIPLQQRQRRRRSVKTEPYALALGVEAIQIEEEDHAAEAATIAVGSFFSTVTSCFQVISPRGRRTAVASG